MCRYIAAAQARSLPGKPDVKFTKAGTLRNVELNIMNLRRGMQVNTNNYVIRYVDMLVQGSGSSKQWEKIGAWRSWDGDNHGLDIQVIMVTRVQC